MLDWPNRSNFSDLLAFRLLEREDGRAVVAVTVEERHANTMGVAHGGITPSLIDTASGAAVARQPSIDNKQVATVSLQASYLAPCFVGDTLTATARRRGSGRTLITCDVQVENQNGDLVAVGLCTLRVRSGQGEFRRR